MIVIKLYFWYTKIIYAFVFLYKKSIYTLVSIFSIFQAFINLCQYSVSIFICKYYARMNIPLYTNNL